MQVQVPVDEVDLPAVALVVQVIVVQVIVVQVVVVLAAVLRLASSEDNLVPGEQLVDRLDFGYFSRSVDGSGYR